MIEALVVLHVVATRNDETTRIRVVTDVDDATAAEILTVAAEAFVKAALVPKVPPVSDGVSSESLPLEVKS